MNKKDSPVFESREFYRRCKKRDIGKDTAEKYLKELVDYERDLNIIDNNGGEVGDFFWSELRERIDDDIPSETVDELIDIEIKYEKDLGVIKENGGE